MCRHVNSLDRSGFRNRHRREHFSGLLVTVDEKFRRVFELDRPPLRPGDLRFDLLRLPQPLGSPRHRLVPGLDERAFELEHMWHVAPIDHVRVAAKELHGASGCGQNATVRSVAQVNVSDYSGGHRVPSGFGV